MGRRRKPGTSIFEQNDQARADFDMVKASRLRKRRTIPSMGSHADYHYRCEGDFLKSMEYARDVQRNDVIASSLLDRADDNTIQDGFMLDFNTGDKKLDRDLNALWSNWAGDPAQCDLAQELTFADMESMAFQSVLVDGDICAVGTDDGCMQWYEGHLLRTPSGSPNNVVHGVELQGGRVRKSYNFCKEELSPSAATKSIPGMSGFNNVATRDSDGVRRVFHIYLRSVRRFSQTRGVTAFSPMFDLFGMHDDTQFNAILKQQIANALLIFKERTEHYKDDGPDSPLGDTGTQPQNDGGTDVLENVGPGTIVKGEKGEKISAFMANVPGQEFFPHVRMILTLLGVNLGLPLILVLMDASETNFSGWRGAFDQAKMGFRKNQGKLIRRYHNPCVDWKVSQFGEKDPILARAVARQIRRMGVLNRIWHTPTWPYVQPLDDRNADLIAVSNYQDSPSGIAAKNGLDFETVGARCISDRGYMIRLAKKEAADINSEFPTDELKVNWMQLYTPPTPAKMSGIQPTGDQPPQPAGQPKKGAAPNA